MSKFHAMIPNMLYPTVVPGLPGNLTRKHLFHGVDFLTLSICPDDDNKYDSHTSMAGVPKRERPFSNSDQLFLSPPEFW